MNKLEPQSTDDKQEVGRKQEISNMKVDALDLEAGLSASPLFNAGRKTIKYSTPSPDDPLFAKKLLRPKNHASEMLTEFKDDPDCQNENLKMNEELNIMPKYSRKVFVGGLPLDIDEKSIIEAFASVGSLAIDWPQNSKGFAFLIFHNERSVQTLIDMCDMKDGMLYALISTSLYVKSIEVRPWCLCDNKYVVYPQFPLDDRKTAFVSGIPRPMKASELALTIDRLYGGVSSVIIDTDDEHYYPKSTGRICFNNQQSFVAIITAGAVQLKFLRFNTLALVEPFISDNKLCDFCGGQNSLGKPSSYFCASINCLQYYCESCWNRIHTYAGIEHHKPMVKSGRHFTQYDKQRALKMK